MSKHIPRVGMTYFRVICNGKGDVYVEPIRRNVDNVDEDFEFNCFIGKKIAELHAEKVREILKNTFQISRVNDSVITDK